MKTSIIPPNIFLPNLRPYFNNDSVHNFLKSSSSSSSSMQFKIIYIYKNFHILFVGYKIMNATYYVRHHHFSATLTLHSSSIFFLFHVLALYIQLEILNYLNNLYNVNTMAFLFLVHFLLKTA